MKPFLPTLALGALLTTLAGPSLAQKQNRWNAAST